VSSARSSRGAAGSEIEEVCEWGRQTTTADDLANFVRLEALDALLHARRGEHQHAEEASCRVGALIESVGFHFPRLDRYRARPEAHALGGRREEAVEWAWQALGIFAAKGDVTGGAHFGSRVRLSGYRGCVIAVGGRC
jgi:hypothetical protein